MTEDAVYRGMSLAELDHQYNARATVADFSAEIARYRRLSDISYATGNVRRDIPYGPGEDERFDLFATASRPAPVFVFIHGGYWRALGRADSAFMGKPLADHGVAVAVVEYSLAPAADLGTIIDQVRRAIARIHADAADWGLDPERLYIGGSSAGAHLAAMSLTSGWGRQYGITANPVAGALLVSGLYDLTPVQLGTPNTWLGLSPSSAARYSPMLQPLSPPKDLIVSWGGTETDEFKRQSHEFAAVLDGAGAQSRSFEIGDRNHFDIITDLADPTRRLFQETLSLIRQTAP